MGRDKTAPKILSISSEYTFETFDSLVLVDAGSDGFRLKDENDNVGIIPTGVPISIAGQAGKASGPITVVAPASGTLAVTAIYYS